MVLSYWQKENRKAVLVQSAAEVDGGAGDVGPLFRGQEAGEIGELLCGADAAEIGADAVAVAAAADRFAGVFRTALTIEGVTINASGSFGLAVCPDHCDNVIDLQRFADLALYKSKQHGEGQVVPFERPMLHDYEFRQRMEAEFRGALEAESIDLVYQPMLELLAYLRGNGFKTFIVSGGGIEFMRVFTERVYGIPPEQVLTPACLTFSMVAMRSS